MCIYGTAITYARLIFSANMNIQASYNLIEENISRLAGSDFPQSMTVPQFVDLIEACKRIPVQRTTTYDVVEVI